jgi:ribosomal protein L12E/L44/L45/RPP1/RPP2
MMSDPAQSGRLDTEFTVDDAASSTAEVKPLDLTTKLEGDEVPEELRGKTVAEVVALQKGMKDALLTSEQGRKNAETLAATAAAATAPPAPVAPPAPTPEPELSDEEIAELHQEDPIKAIKYMNAQAIRTAEKNLEARLGPMLAGTAASVEENARTKYKGDFESIGPEIEAFIQKLPNKGVLANPQGWDDLISLVRGQNIEKVITHRSEAAAEAAKAQAQRDQQDLAGFQGTGQAPRPAAAVPGGVAEMDDIQKEIASKLGMTPEDYIKWGKVTT